MTEQPRIPARPEPDSPPRAALAFDANEFCHFLADCDWTESQKTEFIEELWKIIVGFVDLGFELHPVQQVMDCPKTLDDDSHVMLGSSNKLEIFKPNNTVLANLESAGRTDS